MQTKHGTKLSPSRPLETDVARYEMSEWHTVLASLRDPGAEVRATFRRLRNRETPDYDTARPPSLASTRGNTRAPRGMRRCRTCAFGQDALIEVSISADSVQITGVGLG